MKKRAKKALSFGVAALMAVSSLPMSVLPVTAAVNANQTANGGTPYNFVLKEKDTGAQEIQVDSTDGKTTEDVTKSVSVYIDSTDWADDNYIKSVTLNWCTTSGAAFKDGGDIASSIYYENIVKASTKGTTEHELTLPNGETVSTLYESLFCLAPVEIDDFLGNTYSDALSNCVDLQYATDKVFGAEIQPNGDYKVKFEYDAYDSYDDYMADQGASSATHKTHHLVECDVQQDDDGTYYIEYDYINPGGSKAANYTTEHARVELPCYSTTRTVDKSGTACVPGTNNFYIWSYTGTGRTNFLTGDDGDTTALPLTSFDVVIPAGTEDGTYYVQICSKDTDANLVPLYTASDFETVASEQSAASASNSNYMDYNTTIIGSKTAASYSLPQDDSLNTAYVKIVVGDGGDVTTAPAETTTEAPETTAEPTTTAEPSEDGMTFSLQELTVTPGQGTDYTNDLTLYYAYATNSIDSYGMTATIELPEATMELLGYPLPAATTKALMRANAKVGPTDSFVYSSASFQTDIESFVSGTSTENRIHLGFAATDAVIPAGDGTVLARLAISIPDEDTVKSIAAKYNIAYDEELGGYKFPVEWAEPGTDLQQSGDKMTEVERFSLMGESAESKLDFESTVTLKDGYILVKTDETPVETTETPATTTEEETTTVAETTTEAATEAPATTTEAPATTTAAPATTTEAPATTVQVDIPDGSIRFKLQELTVEPGQGSLGENPTAPYDLLFYYGYVENGVDLTGLSATVELPDATKALLSGNYPLEDRTAQMMRANSKNVSQSDSFAYSAASTFNTDFETNFRTNDDENSFHMGFAENPAVSAGDSTNLFRLAISIPDADTVASIAAQYGVEYDESLGGYKFPVTWAEYGNDQQTSKGANDTTITVDVARFDMADANGNKIDFQAKTTMTDGYILVKMDKAEVITSSTEVSTTTGNAAVDTTSTTTVSSGNGEQPVESSSVEAADVTVKTKVGYYLSVDDFAFDPADLIESATSADGKDISDDLTFGYESPKAMYEALESPYVADKLDVLYQGEVVAQADVYIGVKGDANLDGKVLPTDMQVMMQYQAYMGVSMSSEAYLYSKSDTALETLAYFLIDIDTESKLGKDTSTTLMLSPDDLFSESYYQALIGAKQDQEWDEVCVKLKKLEGSYWARKAAK